MQQMNPDEAKGEWQVSYGRYEGASQYDDGNNYVGSKNQKLQIDEDEQFADMLARKMKQQLQSEMQVSKDSSLGYRLALGIVSVCALVPLFIALVIVVPSVSFEFGSGASAALGWGFVAACAVIFAVNAYFNWAVVETRRSELKLKRDSEEKEQNKIDKKRK